MNIEEYSKKYRPSIAAKIELILKNQPDIFSSKDLFNRLLAFSTNGKMLRAAMVCLASELYGLPPDDSTILVAAAVEMNHSGLLIHDDILDRDILRRGSKTLYAQYSEQGKQKNVRNEDFFGMSMGICSADIVFFIIPQMLSELEVQKLKKVLPLFYREIERVAIAEMYEFEIGQTVEEPTLEEIEKIYEYKTARYTFSLPLALGATLADADQKQIDMLFEFGRQLGIIFQIVDDQIGLVGTEKEIGKPVGSDIRENKKTIIRSMLFQYCLPDEKKELFKLFGKEEISPEDITFVQAKLQKHGILEKISDRVSSQSQELYSLINRLEINQSGKELLSNLVDYNLKRKF